MIAAVSEKKGGYNYMKADDEMEKNMVEVKGRRLVDLCISVCLDGARAFGGEVVDSNSSDLVKNLVKVVVHQWEGDRKVEDFDKRLVNLLGFGTEAGLQGEVYGGETRRHEDEAQRGAKRQADNTGSSSSPLLSRYLILTRNRHATCSVRGYFGGAHSSATKI